MDAYFVGFDPATLAEQHDVEAARERLEALGGRRDLDAVVEKVGLLRITGRLDEAEVAASAAVRQARFEGDREQLARVRLVRTRVHRAAGRLDQAGSELTDLAVEAAAHDWSAIEADALIERALVHVAADRVGPARADFDAALVILVREHASPILIDAAMVAIGALLEREPAS